MGLRRIHTINFLDAFVVSAVGIMLPLAIIERKIDLGTAGLVLSAFPLIYVIIRMFLSIIADRSDFRIFYLLNAASAVISNVIYIYAYSPSAFIAGRFFESIKHSSIWAVNRNSVILESKGEEFAKSTTNLIAIRFIGISLGAVGGGYILASVGFDTAFAIMAFLGIMTLGMAYGMKPQKFAKETTGRMTLAHYKEILGRGFGTFSKNRLFLAISIVMVLEGSFSSLVAGFALPIFLKADGYTYFQIGLVMALYMGVLAASVFIFSKYSPRHRITLPIGALFYALPVAMIFTGYHEFEIALLTFMAISDGIGAAYWEKMIALACKDSESLASDIAILHVLPNIGAFAVLAIFGFLILWLGFWIAFAIGAIMHVLFIVLSAYILTRYGKK